MTLGAPTESPFTRPQLVDMQGWTLLSADRQVVPHELRAQAELLHADLRRAPDALAELYWQAPPSYLGDRVSGPWGGRTSAPVPTSSRGGSGRVGGVQPGHTPLSGPQVSSYGGTLHYELHSESQRGDVFVPTESRPDVVLQVADGRWRPGGPGRASTVGSL